MVGIDQKFWSISNKRCWMKWEVSSRRFIDKVEICIWRLCLVDVVVLDLEVLVLIVSSIDVMCKGIQLTNNYSIYTCNILHLIRIVVVIRWIHYLSEHSNNCCFIE